MRSEVIKEYLNPIRIIAKSDNVENADCLLTNKNTQVYLREDVYMSCKGSGYIILDFGREIHGGARLLSYFSDGHKLLNVRLRFGESVGETSAELGEKNATNDHSIRDMVITVTNYSDQEWGKTGYRFLRIDFLNDDNVCRLTNVYAASTYRDEEYIGEFNCSDQRVNEIYQTARYTLFLNMQDNLWEGVKRDRLVWIGDMQPEVLALNYLFGEHRLVEKAIAESVEKNPLPCWFGSIPTYSGWFMQIVSDYYIKTGKREFFTKYLTHFSGVLEQLDGVVLSDGHIDYKQIPLAAYNEYFLDWPSYGAFDSEEGNRAVFIVALRTYLKACEQAGITPDPLCERVLSKLNTAKQAQTEHKQIVALAYLAGRIDRATTAEKLTKGGAEGLSTFMSYFILKALAECSGEQTAIDIMKDYYGGMLDGGATTFWEDFDINWLKGSGRIDELTPDGLKDLHGDHGAYCYVGFRHSLCHGWSCGPVQFLMESILGVNILSAGCSRIAIEPKLGDLEYANAKLPTPYGVVEVNARRADGKTLVEIRSPKGIEIIAENAKVIKY